ncbi:MAG TPA: hypothetical protein VIF09_02310 [Polyangiaceae bacterium]|jgi:hypothetical protein
MVRERSRHGRAVVASTALVAVSLLLASDAPAREVPHTASATDTPATAIARDVRSASWASALPPLEVTSLASGGAASLRLYAPDGELDEGARMRFEHLVARDGEQHVLATRLEQLVVKASHRFHDARVMVVSAWRGRAGRHTAGEALDFKLEGVQAGALASYLRGLARVGVGVYTHPKTQYVHLDVRDASYHWIDASPPGITWRERQMRDPGQTARDARWTPEDDLPF